MIPLRGLVQTMKGWLGKPIATPETDPSRYFGSMMALPNPDPVLRQMGRAEQVYADIMTDAHVMGEVRSIRGSFRSYDYRIVAGDDEDAKSQAARELCETWMQTHQPNQVADWLEVMWQMTSAILTGYRAHEIVWGNVGGQYLPIEVADRPNHRFQFKADGSVLLRSRGTSFEGAAVEPYQFVISRHMASTTNPYGYALLSSCFWPRQFKTGGWRYFVKYCERHGLPWPVGKYPAGTGEEEQDKFAEALASMVESGYLLMQDGSGVELLVPQGGAGAAPQQALISLCNREMSKALTSQSMVGEQLEVGSRAASDTAKDRQDTVHDSDRDIAASSMGQIFRWITLFNFGEGVAAPKLDFFKQEAAGKERAEVYQIAHKLGARPSRSAMLEELDIPEAKDDADLLAPQSSASNPRRSQPGTDAGDSETGTPRIDLSGLVGLTFAKQVGMTDDEATELASQAADQAIEDAAIKPVAQMLAQFEAEGKTLAEFRDAFEDMVGEIDDEALREVIERAMTYSALRGRVTGAA